MTAVCNLTRFYKRHKSVSGSSGTVAGGTERRNIIHSHKPVYNFIKCSAVTNIKLCSIFRAFFFAISSNTCAASTTNLTNTQSQNSFTRFLRFAGRNNHACVRNCNSNAGYNFCKSFIINSVWEKRRIYAICSPESWNRNCVWSTAFGGFKMLCVHKLAYKLIFISSKSVKNSATNIINSTVHSAVHCFCVVSIVRFWAGWVQLFIALFVVGFLEQNVSSNFGILESCVIVYSCCGNVYVYTSDCTVFMLD